MKTFVALAALVAVAHGAAILGSTGSSTVSRSQDGAGNYAFSYDESHATGGSFRRESGAPGAVTGSYGLRDADGRVRTVNYIADAAGFRASISSNEPGVEPKSPADTLINGAAPVVAVAAAPAAVVAAAPARLAAPAFAAAPVAVAPAAPAAISGISYSSTVNHAAPARLIAAAAAPAPLLAPAPLAPQQIVAANPWGYTAQW